MLWPNVCVMVAQPGLIHYLPWLHRCLPRVSLTWIQLCGRWFCVVFVKWEADLSLTLIQPLTSLSLSSILSAFSLLSLSCFQATSPVNSSDLWVTPIGPCFSGSYRFRSWVWRLSRFPTECLKDSHLGLESGEEQWSRSEYMRGSCELLVIVECLIVWVTFGVARVFWPSIQRFLIVWLVAEACGEVLGLV